MKTAYLMIVLVLFLSVSLLMACGPRYTLDYRPSSGMFDLFTADQNACQDWAGWEAMNYHAWRTTYSDAYDISLIRCMKSKGWNKVKIYDLPLKKGYGEKGVKYYGD